MDLRAVVRRDPASLSGEGLRVTGFSAGAGRVLVVILVPKEHLRTDHGGVPTAGQPTTVTAATTRRHDDASEHRGHARR